MLRKTISIIICISLFVMLCACGGSTEKNNATPEPAKIELRANPTTGFHWEYKISEKNVVKIESDYVQDENKQGFVGVGGTQYYTVTPLKRGEVTITFEYQAPGTNLVAYEAIYVYSVGKNLKITEKSHSGSYFDSLDNN